jgi:hypothetical protein
MAPAALVMKLGALASALCAGESTEYYLTHAEDRAAKLETCRLQPYGFNTAKPGGREALEAELRPTRHRERN